MSRRSKIGHIDRSSWDETANSSEIPLTTFLKKNEVIKHVIIDINRSQHTHRDIYPLVLSPKQREAAEKSKTDTSGDMAIRPVESTVVSRQGLRKRRRRAVQDSGDEDEQPSRDASGGQSSSQEQLECALDTIKKLQALVREQGDEITELKLRLTTEQ